MKQIPIEAIIEMKLADIALEKAKIAKNDNEERPLLLEGLAHLSNVVKILAEGYRE